MKRLLLLVVSAIVVLELPAPASQEQTAFTLGVLRRDGLVVPFAAFKGRRWNEPWPTDIRRLELPISLADIPERWWGTDQPPAKLAIWRDGTRAGEVTLTGVTTTFLMCEPRFALKSDYKPATPPPPPFERPYPKEGLVISGNVAVQPIEMLDKGSADWNRLLILLKSDFDREENRAARAFTSWRHPISEDQRKRFPVVLEAVYRAPTTDPGWTAHYIEAVRQYPPGREDRDGCGLATFASGWIMVGPKDELKGRLSAKVTYCDRKGVSYMLPFGLVRANDDVFWVFQFSGFDEEWYEVAEASRSGVKSQVAYRAGMCPN
jgi:hypothetical protein